MKFNVFDENGDFYSEYEEETPEEVALKLLDELGYTIQIKR